ncbi:unnamed protein product, partial [Tetraodon nigroviridis]
SSAMNPVYSPVQPGTPYGNPKNMAFPGYPGGYPATTPTYTPNLYQTGSPGYPPGSRFAVAKLSQLCSNKICKTSFENRRLNQPFSFRRATLGLIGTRFFMKESFSGYTSAGTPYKVPPTQSNGAPPPYTPTPTPYPTPMYPIRSAYPQQNIYAQGAYYTQPVYAAQPHVIHHTTVVQPNSIPSTALYPATRPRTYPSQQQHSCHGDGSRDNHGDECR